MAFKDGLRKIYSKVSARHRFFRGAKGKMQDDYQKLKQWNPSSNMGKVARAVVLGGIDVNWFLFCLGKYISKDVKIVFWDNQIIDKLKDKKQNLEDGDSGFKKFFVKLQKAHPKTAARLHLWMLYTLTATAVFSGGKASHYNNAKDKKEDVKEVVEEEGLQSMSYQTFCESLKPFTPWLVADLIMKEGVVLDEQGMHKPYKDSRGIWTIGFGSTMLKDKTKVTKNTPHMTTEEAYELARWHIEENETYPMLYWYYVYDNDLLLKTTNSVIGFGSVFYNAFNNLVENKKDKNNRNRFAELRILRDSVYGMNIPDSLVLDCFSRYPITETFSFGDAWLNHSSYSDIANTLIGFCKGGDGMYWRRWLEAGLITGDITPTDILNCPVNGVADFFFTMNNLSKDNKSKRDVLWQEFEDGTWQPKKSSFKDFKEWVKEPIIVDKKGRTGSIANRSKVKDFLPAEIQEYLMQNEFQTNKDIRYSKSRKTKTVAFNDGVKKIKNMQHNNIMIQSANNRDFLS